MHELANANPVAFLAVLSVGIYLAILILLAAIVAWSGRRRRQGDEEAFCVLCQRTPCVMSWRQPPTRPRGVSRGAVRR